MNYKLNINIAPYSNVIIDMDSESDSNPLVESQIRNAIINGLRGLEILEVEKAGMAKAREENIKDKLLTRLYLLMDTKEYDSARFFAKAEITFADDLAKKPNDLLLYLIEMLELKQDKKNEQVNS
jgi:hypothetical protein